MGDEPGQSKLTKILIGIGAFVFASVFITIYIACLCKRTEQRIRNEVQNEKNKKLSNWIDENVNSKNNKDIVWSVKAS